MLKESLALSEQTVFNDFADNFDIKGKDILEIGGCLPFEYFEEHGVNSWVAIDPRNRNAKINEIYTSVNGYAQLILFEDNHFDYLFSCNAFQHIQCFDAALNEMLRVLKPGGVLYANFGPIWSSPDGSHIENVFYKDKAYNFWDESFIPDWYHLVYNCRELYEILSSKINSGLAKALSEFVYLSDWLNRLEFKDYKRIVESCLFSEIIFFGGAKEFGYERIVKDYTNNYKSKYDNWICQKQNALDDYKYRDLKICLRK